MRVASLVIGLFIGIIVFGQSCTVSVLFETAEQLGGVTEETEAGLGEAGAGLLVAFLAVFGAAFAMGNPRLSAWLFALGAVLGVLVGATAEVFGDLVVWGVLLLVPTLTSYLAQRQRRVESDGNSSRT